MFGGDTKYTGELLMKGAHSYRRFFLFTQLDLDLFIFVGAPDCTSRRGREKLRFDGTGRGVIVNPETVVVKGVVLVCQ